jgi:hypothetical protein
MEEDGLEIEARQDNRGTMVMRDVLRASRIEDSFGGGNRHAKSNLLHPLHCGWVLSQLTFRALDRQSRSKPAV